MAIDNINVNHRKHHNVIVVLKDHMAICNISVNHRKHHNVIVVST